MSESGVMKQERMHIRLDSLAKQKLEKAAQFSHKSLSEFVLSYALASANEIIEEHEKMVLTQNDWNVFLDALENPPIANTALKQAFELHEKSVKPLPPTKQ